MHGKRAGTGRLQKDTQVETEYIKLDFFVPVKTFSCNFVHVTAFVKTLNYVLV